MTPASSGDPRVLRGCDGFVGGSCGAYSAGGHEPVPRPSPTPGRRRDHDRRAACDGRARRLGVARLTPSERVFQHLDLPGDNRRNIETDRPKMCRRIHA